jgi:hypothetical protein
MRGIMPMTHRSPPELTIVTGLFVAGLAVYSSTWVLVVVGAGITGLGVYELWRARRGRE